MKSDGNKQECVKIGVIKEESVNIDGKIMSLLIGLHNIFIQMENVLA